MRLLFLHLFGLFLFVFSGISYAEYTLGAGDYVKVTVYGDAELTRETRVSDDGKISLPLVGEVKVGGLTTIAAEKKIAEDLKKGGFLINPQVSVLLMQFNSKTVSIFGGVSKPGRYPITRPTDIKDLLAEAGGIASNGSEIITLVRDGKAKAIDLRNIIALSNSQDFRLMGGETLFVGENDVAVVGQLQRPGKFGIQIGARKISDFIALAGGVTEQSGDTINYTTISKGESISESINIDSILKFPNSDLNREVKPGDVIYIPKAPQVYVYGEVQKPGVYKIDKDMNIMQAIVKASGLTQRGTQRGVKLQRKNTSGVLEKISPDLTTTLQDQDILYVEESLI